MVQDKDEELWVDLYAMWVVLAENLYPLTCTIPKMLDKNRAWDAHFYTVLRIRPLPSKFHGREHHFKQIRCSRTLHFFREQFITSHC